MSPLTEPTKLTLAKNYTPIDWEAADYARRVELVDGQPLEDGVFSAINAFVLGCKQDGIWSAIRASCILAGARTLSGALVPLVGSAPTNVGPFVSGDYSRKTGLVGNGSTKYLDCNRANNAEPQNNKHVSVYATSGSTTNGPAIASGGWNAGGSGHTTLFLDTSGSRMLPRLNGDGTGGIVGGAPVTPCLIAASRSASTGFTLRRSSANTTVTYNSQTPSVSTLKVFGPHDGYINARLAFYSIGESLDLALLDARVTALITAFGAVIP